MTDKETRSEATDRVTAQAGTWLWKRGCRAMTREAGLTDSGHITTAWGGRWRVDLVGVVPDNERWRGYVVEVKGTFADFSREKIYDQRNNRHWSRSKWHRPEFARINELWLACGDLKTAWAAKVDVPEHWGIILFPVDGKVKVMRKPVPGPVKTDKKEMYMDMAAIAKVTTSLLLPSFFNSPSQKGKSQWERLIDSDWYRSLPASEEDGLVSDNKQMEMFSAESPESAIRDDFSREVGGFGQPPAKQPKRKKTSKQDDEEGLA